MAEWGTSRFNHDILSNVCILLMRSCERPKDSYGRLSRRVSWDWVTVTKVCRHWRSVALDYSPLWSEIFAFKHPEKVLIFLERSRQVDLYVDLSMCPIGDCTNVSVVFDCLERHMWRVKEFKVDASIPSTYWEGCMKCLSATTRQMKVLCIEAPYGGLDFKIADLLKIKPALQLDSLSLDGVRIKFNNSLLAGLSDLKLVNTMKSLDNLDFVQLLDVLGQSPKLRRLELDDIWKFNLPDTDKSYRVIQLSHLECAIFLNIPLAIFFAVSQFVKIPKDASRHVSLIDYPVKTPSALPVEFLEELNPCHTIGIHYEGYIVRRLTVLADPVKNSENLSYKSSISLRTSERSIGSFGATLSMFLSHPYWTRASAINITFGFQSRGMQKTAWNHLFSCLPTDIKELTIGVPSDEEKGFTAGLIHALSNKTVIARGRKERRFPKLDHLVIQLEHDSKFVAEWLSKYDLQLVKCIEDRNRCGETECKLSFDYWDGIDSR